MDKFPAHHCKSGIFAAFCAMTSESPLLALLRPPKAARDQAAIRALLTAQPDLANILMTQSVDSKPLSYTLTTGDIVTSKLLLEFGAKSRRAPLVEAAWSTDLDTVQWVFDSGLDTGLDGSVADAVLAPRVATDATVVPMFNFLIPKGLRIPLPSHLHILQKYPKLTGFLVSRGWFTVDMYTAPLTSPGARTLQEAVKLGDLAPPFTYALLPDASNKLFVEIANADPAAGAVPASLAAAISASGTPAVNYSLESEVVDTATPLFFALSRGNVSAATALVLGGANVLYRRTSGETCVGAAARSGKPAAIEYIVSAIRAKVGPFAVKGFVDAQYTDSRGSLKSALVKAIVSYKPLGVVAALLAANANPNLVVATVPTAGWIGYAVQDRNAAAAAAFDASGILRALVAGNAEGVKANIDTYVAVLNGTVREFNAKYGVVL